MTFAAPPAREDLTAAFDAFSMAALKTMARSLGVKPPAEQRAAYVETIASVVGTPEHRASLEARLQRREWDLLNLLPTRFGPFRLRVLLVDPEHPGSLSEAGVNSTLTLFGCGCLVPAGRLRPGAARLGIDRNGLLSIGINTPLVFTPGVADWAVEHRPLSQSLHPGAPPERISGASLPDLQRMAYVILTEAGRRPIRLTREGQPYKADVRNLAAAAAPAEGKKLRGYTAPVPPLVFFSLAVLESAGLLVERSAELRPAARAEQFFSAPQAGQARTLLDGWYPSRFKDFLLIPGLDFGWGNDFDAPWFGKVEDAYGAYGPRQIGVSVGRRCITTAIAEGAEPDPGAWYPIADIARTVFWQYPEMLYPRLNDYGYFGFSPSGRPGGRQAYMYVHRSGDGTEITQRDVAVRPLYQDSDWMEVEGAFVREAIAGPLCWLGLTEVGGDADAPTCFRLTALGQQLLCGRPAPEAEPAPAGRRAVVQPDYEVIVLDAARNLNLLSQLDAIADRCSVDRAATYRLTQTELARGLDRGWTGKRVLAALEGANGGPLPQNVRYSLDEWINRYESLTLHEATCLIEADDPAQLDGWLADPAMAKLLGDRLGPTAVQIPRSHVNALLGQLQSHGLSPAAHDYAQPATAVLDIEEPDQILLDARRAEPYLRYQLEAFSEPLGEIHTRLRYRMTEAGVRRAIKLGWRESQLRSFLSRAASKGLPPDFSVRLSGWAGTVPAVQAETLVAVALPAVPVSWQVLRAVPEIGALIRALPAPGLALVALGDLDQLQGALQARGIRLQSATLRAGQLAGTPEAFDGPTAVPHVLVLHDAAGVDEGSDDAIDLQDLAWLADPADFLRSIGLGRKPKRGR